MISSGAPDEFQELLGDLGKARLVGEKFVGETVDSDDRFVDGALRSQVDVKTLLGLPPVPQFDAADFDDPMPWAGSRPVVSVSSTT